MDEDDVLVGGESDEDDEDFEEVNETVEGIEEEEEADEMEDEEEEPEGMVDGGEEEVEKIATKLAALSVLTVEYNRQHSYVPEENVVRDHNRPHPVATPEKLGEMKASNTTTSRWPMSTEIDPASIVVVHGLTSGDDQNPHFVWYLRVVVEGREDESGDKDALLHIPKGTCKDMLSNMAKDRELCQSSLITTYMPTNFNESKILPKLNGWECLKAAPKTLAIKPKIAGQGAKQKNEEREAATGESGAPTAPTASKKVKPIVKAADKSADKAADKAAAKAAAKAAGKSAEKATDKPVEKSADKAAEKAAAPPKPKAPAQSKKDGKTTTAASNKQPASNPFDKAKGTAVKKTVAASPAPAPPPAAYESADRGPEVASTGTGADPSQSLTDPGIVSRAMSIDKTLTSVTHEYTFDIFARKYIEFSPPEGAVRAEAKIVYHFL